MRLPSRLERTQKARLPVSNGIMPTQTENCDDNKKQYYDLTGIRVQHPQKGGVYIVRQNGRIYKEVLR